MNKIDWSEKSIFRKIIIILSALQVVAFFALPYARMNSAVGSLNSLANSFGASTGIPNNLTGFAAVKEKCWVEMPLHFMWYYLYWLLSVRCWFWF